MTLRPIDFTKIDVLKRLRFFQSAQGSQFFTIHNFGFHTGLYLRLIETLSSHFQIVEQSHKDSTFDRSYITIMNAVSASPCYQTDLDTAQVQRIQRPGWTLKALKKNKMSKAPADHWHQPIYRRTEPVIATPECGSTSGPAGTKFAFVGWFQERK